jgi:hypothetical protein
MHITSSTETIVEAMSEMCYSDIWFDNISFQGFNPVSADTTRIVATVSKICCCDDLGGSITGSYPVCPHNMAKSGGTIVIPNVTDLINKYTALSASFYVNENTTLMGFEAVIEALLTVLKTEAEAENII